MKYIKLFILGLLPWILGACNKEEEVALNTGDATVEFESASVTVKESVTSVNLPIVVKGEHTGKIVVYATMTEKSEGIEIDKNVIITTETLNFLEGTETLELEVGLAGISNEEIIDGRSITFEIKEVKGAKVGVNNTCTINLIENNPIEGIYVVGGVDYYSVGKLECELSMVEGSNDEVYLDFGTGDMVLVKFTDIEGVFDKCNFTIEANQKMGPSNYGDIYFRYGKVENVGEDEPIADEAKAFSGTFENKTFTFDIDPNCGFGFNCSAGWFNFYMRYQDTPLTIYKK